MRYSASMCRDENLAITVPAHDVNRQITQIFVQLILDSN